MFELGQWAADARGAESSDLVGVWSNHVGTPCAIGHPTHILIEIDRAHAKCGERELVVLCVLGQVGVEAHVERCLLYTSPSPRDLSTSRMPSSA